MSESVEKSIQVSQIVTFRMASEEYGVDIMKVQEIILPGKITRVPEVPKYIDGVINLRGSVIPIIDLRVRFDLERIEPTEETRIIVANVSGRVMGFVVDAVNEVMRISVQNIAPPPQSIGGNGRDYIQGLIKQEKRLLILLDIDKLIGAEQSEAIMAQVS